MEKTEAGLRGTKIYKGKVADRKMWSNWDLDIKLAGEWWKPLVSKCLLFSLITEF